MEYTWHDLVGNLGVALIVLARITSYNVCYTKLLRSGDGCRHGDSRSCFDLLLMDTPPELVMIIDAITVPDRRHGEVFTIDVAKVPTKKLADFSLHQCPSSNLLTQLAQRGTRITSYNVCYTKLLRFGYI